MKNPLFSVVIPLYNKEETIFDTVQSVLCQTFKDFELIIVNDGSKDNGPFIVQEIASSHIRIIHQENAGVSAARNKGIEVANGVFIAFLDGDDRWEENHLEQLYSLIKEYSGKANVFTTNFARRFPDGEVLVNRTDLERGIVTNYFKSCINRVVIHTSCVSVSKEALISTKGFNPKFSMGEDIDLWNRLARKYSVAYSPVVTSTYEIGAPNNSCNTINYKRDAAKEALKGLSFNFYDILLSLRRYLFYLVKKTIRYKPHVKKHKR